MWLLLLLFSENRDFARMTTETNDSDNPVDVTNRRQDERNNITEKVKYVLLITNQVHTFTSPFIEEVEKKYIKEMKMRKIPFLPFLRHLKFSYR